MRYQALQHKTLKLESKAQIDYDARDGAYLVPDENSKVFLHWKNDSGKILATYTMTFPTKIEGKVTLINALDRTVQIRAIW
jgi:hypothetical protein